MRNVLLLMTMNLTSKLIKKIFKSINKKNLLIAILLVLFMWASLVFFGGISGSLLAKVQELIRQPFVMNLMYNILEARSSITKIANIVHFPYWFYETKLPVFELTIGQEDLGIMNANLPVNFFSQPLLSENKVFVPALFSSDDYDQEVQIRYRGAFYNHWTKAKRSLLVKFSKEYLFDHMKSIDMIVPRDRGYLIEFIDNQVLARWGLPHSNMFFARVNVNGKDAGVYLIKERYEKSWLEKNAFPETSEVFSQTSEAPLGVPILITDAQWRRDINEENTSFEELETLYNLIQYAPDQVFWNTIGNLVDLEIWYKAIAINILAGGGHSIGPNLNLIFNSATGRFEPLLEDIHIYDKNFEDPIKIYSKLNLLSRRILSNQSFYEEYRQILASMASPDQLDKTLLEYDELYEKMRPEFYKDQTKYKNDFSVDSRIKEIRSWIITNYENAQKLAQIENTPILEIFENDITKIEPKGSFEKFYDISLSVEEFVRENPQFLLSQGDLLLPAGTYSFPEDIIIPRGTKLIINPGVKIYLGAGVSIVSYSPIEAVGLPQDPILIARVATNQNWGSIVIVNNNEVSRFEYVTMVGGSSSHKINGVVFTGMLSAYNADLIVNNSQFYMDSDDDMINVKYATGEIKDSLFSNSNSDAVDLDMTDDFKVMGSKFSNIGIQNVEEGGDAIDLSFSVNAFISDNEINDCGDKGISVGEISSVTISNNQISGCAIGVAVKDDSTSQIKDNVFTDNNEAISLYNKKDIFGGGSAVLSSNMFENNNYEVNTDSVSEVIHSGNN